MERKYFERVGYYALAEWNEYCYLTLVFDLY